MDISPKEKAEIEEIRCVLRENGFVSDERDICDESILCIMDHLVMKFYNE